MTPDVTDDLSHSDLARIAIDLTGVVCSEAGAVNSTAGLWSYFYTALVRERERKSHAKPESTSDDLEEVYPA